MEPENTAANSTAVQEPTFWETASRHALPHENSSHRVPPHETMWKKLYEYYKGSANAALEALGRDVILSRWPHAEHQLSRLGASLGILRTMDAVAEEITGKPRHYAED